MEEPISISNLNDFIFCPASIYFHNIYGEQDRILYQSTKQINGTYSHNNVDKNTYSTSKYVLQGINIYCSEYNLIGKIDCFNIKTGTLTERKRKVINIYDGYINQVYGQCFALREMGYTVNKIIIHSFSDNKNYFIDLPENNKELFDNFKKVIDEINVFSIKDFKPTNVQKCNGCIYEDICAFSMKEI